MAAAGAALAAIIPQEKLTRALVIDDEVDFQEVMTDYFETRGYSIDLANNLDEAKTLLDETEYQIVMADVNFGDLDLKGDTFVLKYKNFKGARVVVVTGRNLNNLRHRNALEKLEIPMWDKGDQNWGTNLNALTEATSKARNEELSHELNNFIRGKLGGSGNYVLTGSAAAATATAMAKAETAAAPWELAVEDILIGWLQSQQDQERSFFLIGRHAFSASKMVDQVRRKTDVGKELLGMFVTEVKHSLGLSNKPNLLGEE